MYRREPTVYIGYDPREDTAFQTLVHSIKLTTTNQQINIVKLNQDALRAAGLYRRAWNSGAPTHPLQKIDTSDGKPFSSDFSFTRFLIPHLNQYEGMAIYMDCDMMVRSDIMEVFETYNDPTYAISCVWHQYKTESTFKMDHQAQQNYSKKNWSSFILWNCSHPAHADLTVDDVSTKSGWWLHNFRWLSGWELGRPSQYPIGQIKEEWNWLDGHSSPVIDAKNVHFTTGGPWFENWKPKTEQDLFYSHEWQALKDKVSILESMEDVS